jgi:hypothetical protein
MFVVLSKYLNAFYKSGLQREYVGRAPDSAPVYISRAAGVAIQTAGFVREIFLNWSLPVESFFAH